MNSYKIKFKNMERIEKFYSQAGQDLFVLSCLDGKEGGTFLDLGCNHPTKINNTFLLEEKFGWTGISIDLDNQMIDLYPSNRKSIALCADATKINFDEIIEKAATSHFDYLSLDLEPASITEQCLKNIPLEKVEFSIVTYEHDYYRFGEKFKITSNKILESHGYKRICSNVLNGISPFEDWYYNPKYISSERIKDFECSSKEWREIIFEDGASRLAAAYNGKEEESRLI